MASTSRSGSRSQGADRRDRSLAPRVARAFACAVSLLIAADPARTQSSEPADDPAASAIRFYQRHVSSLRHLRCRFQPSCSEFAAQAIARHGLVEGSARAADRLMRCNASAPGAYPPGDRGQLLDPVDPARDPAAGRRLPSWLLPEPASAAMPTSRTLAPDLRARVEETLDFARVLERRGELDAVPPEVQRAAHLADTVAADAWAFTRIGDVQYNAARWADAERAYLTAAMILPAGARPPAALRAAASRFAAGQYAACARLLGDPVFSRPAAPDERDPLSARAAAIGGLCLLARGEWTEAEARFTAAAGLAGEGGLRERVTRLPAFAREGPELPRRSPGLAAALSAVVPGAGQAYCGRIQDGFRHLLFNAAMIYSVVALVRADEVPGAIVVGSVAAPFHFGNVLGARLSAQRFNQSHRLVLVERALADPG